ncbi:MAG: DUF6478 family protein [Gemmobacter sp.]|jgi:hypothetical protein
MSSAPRDAAAPLVPELHPPGHDCLWHAPALGAAEGPVAPGAALAPGVRVFHDGAPEALRLWPLRGGIGFALQDFGGSYVSLALALPAEVMAGLSSRHVLRLTLRATQGAPVMRARVNLRCGPNVARMLRKIAPEGATLVVEHDLWHLPFDQALLREGWIDILAEPARQARFGLADLSLSRRWRAEV